MSKRTPQQPPNTPPGKRKGITVWVDGTRHDFPRAIGWGIDSNGIVGIGEPSGRYNEAGAEMTDTVASFKAWSRVGWTKP